MKASIKLSYKFTAIISFGILIKFAKYVLENYGQSQDHIFPDELKIL